MTLESLHSKEQVTILQKDMASIKKDLEKFVTKEQLAVLQNDISLQLTLSFS